MVQYVGVLLLVFVRSDLKDAVSDVQTSEKGIGLLGFGVSLDLQRLSPNRRPRSSHVGGMTLVLEADEAG